MPADGTEVDERAERALAALRQGRPAPDTDRRPAWWLDPRGRVEAAILDDRRLWVGIVAVLGAVAVGALAWFALRPTASSGDGSADAFFSAPPISVAQDGGTPSPPESGPGTGGTSGNATTAAMVVHAAGAIRSPGIHPLSPGARVADLLAAAGGPTEDADLDRLNLAAPVVDGQRIYVPRHGEVAPPTVGPDAGGAGPAVGGSGSGGGVSGPVDLNTASADELDALPGVGPATARAIIDHRTKNGPFATIDDLLDVRGIGPSKLEGLRDQVAVG